MLAPTGWPTVQIGVTPLGAMLYGGQTQQFTASVTNTNNTAVNWTVSPTGTGSITSSGLYTAPTTISSEQTVTITASSQASRANRPLPQLCFLQLSAHRAEYSYVRQIVINHTHVPNTDQTNFPFLVNVIDPLLATTAHNGHVTNSNGYDIVFSSDPNGLSILNFEIEEYVPASGQLVAWVNIPTLSHGSNTVLYMFYGNPSITTSQQNSTAVWDSNYQAVYHLANIASGTQKIPPQMATVERPLELPLQPEKLTERQALTGPAPTSAQIMFRTLPQHTRLKHGSTRHLRTLTLL